MTMDGRIMHGVEALIRWQHPARGLVAPAEFIPLAEESGLIVPLGLWVLRAACRQACRWRDAGLPQLYITVNLSGQQLKQPGVAATIRAILAEAGLEPQWLSVELTESILMENAEATVAALHELRAIGLHSLAIDDFGTGYSSLSYLQRFPVTTIKIDRSFVHDLTTNPSNAALARAIIALAESLGLETVAEGVETEAQREFLERAGCDRFQGYLVSRPLPAEQLEALLPPGHRP
jgi:EAL domain-containing protein (putative c-di-GMP-specific phosphodiesterase class I)